MIARCLAGGLALAVLAGVAPAQAADPHGNGNGTWRFEVRLDDKPIGEHVFRVAVDGDRRTVQSDASFTVTLLGIAAYRYRHHASEQWRGNCLDTLNAETDDDGERLTVAASVQGDALAVDDGHGTQRLPRCAMSFAYWNPALRGQTHLLNAQTGKFEAVRIAEAGAGQLMVRGTPVQAVRWRITGTERPIDVWYSAAGEWVGLDAAVRGGRQLSYRLK